MIKFAEYPYVRPDMADLTARMEEQIRRILNAKTLGEAFLAIVESDHIEQVFVSYATISEAGNTNNSYDKFYAEEEAFFSKAKPEFSLLMQKRNQAIFDCKFVEELRGLLGGEFFDAAKMRARTVSESVLDIMNQEGILSQEYSVIMSQMSAMVGEEKLSLGQLAQRGNSSDHEVRRKYNILGEEAMLKAADRLDTLYHDMVQLRHQVALGTGFANYTDYCLCKHGRTGYGREELKAFADAVEHHLVPLVSEVMAWQAAQLDYPMMHYDENNAFPGRQVTITKELLPAFKKIFGKLSPETKVLFDELTRREFYDLELRDGKTNGAYSNLVPLCRMPYIFETYNATPGAVKTFAHECGHGLNTFMHRGETVMGAVDCSSDIAETHSMSMEFFIWHDLDAIVNEEDIELYKYMHLMNTLTFIPYGTAIDRFQTEVYDHPEMTPEERRALWKDLEKRFIPWRKYEPGLFYDSGRIWQRQIHVMKWPFYYIDYVLAQVCALQFWALDQKDHETAFESYLELIRNSGRYSFSEVIHKAGLKTPFEPGVMETICKQVEATITEMRKSL